MLSNTRSNNGKTSCFSGLVQKRSSKVREQFGADEKFDTVTLLVLGSSSGTPTNDSLLLIMGWLGERPVGWIYDAH